MAKITNAQLVAANIALEARVAALEARLELGHEVCRAQRAKLAEFEARLASPGKVAQTASVAVSVPRAPTPLVAIVTQYTDRFGRLFERTRVGSQATIRQLLVG